MLAGKNIIVTGARRGIGKAIVKRAAENGANVWACARRHEGMETDFEEECQRLSVENEVTVKPVFFDLVSKDEMRDAARLIKDTGLSVDGLVNVAGVVLNANFNMTSMEKQQELFTVNYFSQVQWTQYILKTMMRQKKGCIVNIASSGGLDFNPGRSAYNASKAAWAAASGTLAREMGRYGIRVNTVAPGLIDTDMARNNTPEQIFQETIQNTALGRIGMPEEIANAVIFLLSDFASYITGQILRVDGGMS